MKKTLSILLSVIMAFSAFSLIPFSASADNDYYLVVGDNAEIFGTVWDASNSSNIMTPDGNGKYTKSYTVSKAYKKVMLKVVSNSGWYGDEQGKNYAFKIKGAGTFTVSFDTSINKIEVTGSVIAPDIFEYSYVNVVGNGSGNWLNGVAWQAGNSANKMTEISQDIWQIEYYDVPAGSDYTFKFVVDGSYETNFGGTFTASGVTTDAVYNADDNITFNLEKKSNVVLSLDLSDYDSKLQQGAKFTVAFETDEPATYYDGELGPLYTPSETTFRYWAPQASEVKIEFYDTTYQEPLAMQKLKEDGKWTGVWTYTLEGYTYDFTYSFIVDGVKCSDPYGTANTPAGESKTNNIPTSDIHPDDWDYDCHVLYDDGEASDVMYYLDIGSFMSNPNSGCADMYRGKYLSLVSEYTTVDNEGNVPTGISFLKNYSDSCSVCIDIANTSGQLMIPDCKYTCDLYNAEMSVYEVKAAIKALHDNGIAVYLKIDFSTAPFTDDMLTKYIVDTCTYWVNEYHIDGFILKSMISSENEDALRDALDSIDSRLFLAGTSKYRLVSDDYLKGLSTGANSIAVANGMVNKSYLYNRTTGNMDDLTLTVVAMSRGRMTLSFGQNFGGYGDSIDWSKLGNSYDSETGEPVFNDNYNYFRQLMEIRRAFKPLYSSAGTVQQKTSGNTIECNYTNAAENTDEWQKLKVLINPDAVVRNFTNSENWVVIAKSGTTDGTVDYKNGLEVINGTNVSVPAKSAVIMADKASFDERNAVKYDLWVGGKQVTSANAADVFGDGTVSYNPKTKTLTLNNANISTPSNAIYSINSDLNIELIGNNNISITGYSAGIQFNKGNAESAKLIFEGSGTLNLESDCINGITLFGTMIVDGANVNVNSKGSAISSYDDSKIIVQSGSLNLKSDESYGIYNNNSGDKKGSIQVSGGTLDVTSGKGGTNITNITVAADLGYSIGNALSESGHIVIEKHIHSYTAKVTAPTCTEKGYTTHTCSCNVSYVDTYVDALGHDFGDNEKVCKRCGTANPDYKEPAPEPEAPVLSPEDAALPTVEKTDEEVKKTNTDKKDVVGATYLPLQLKATNKKNNVTLKWKTVKGAEGYIIYGSRCGTKMEKLATVTNAKTTSYTFKKLVKGKYYKYIVAAYKTTADGERVITKSKSVHVATDGGKRGNPTGLTVNKSKLTLKKGKKATLKAKLKSKKGVMTHIAKFRYESSNTSVATVDKNGKIKATGKGTATIYVYTQNGIVKTIKVKVK